MTPVSFERGRERLAACPSRQVAKAISASVNAAPGSRERLQEVMPGPQYVFSFRSQLAAAQPGMSQTFRLP